jgi:hypothetical protein
MYESLNCPDWIVLLSGSDYPITLPSVVFKELSAGPYDVYIDHREITSDKTRSAHFAEVSNAGFYKPGWERTAYDRYVAINLRYPFCRTRRFLIRHPAIARRASPFGPNLRCFAGDHWFTANRHAVSALLTTSQSNQSLLSHYAGRHSPDESFYQTVFCNQQSLRICADNKRYSDWSLGGSHPKYLDSEDFDRLISGTAHFARKFLPSSALLDALDRHLGIKTLHKAVI